MGCGEGKNWGRGMPVALERDGPIAGVHFLRSSTPQVKACGEEGETASTIAPKSCRREGVAMGSPRGPLKVFLSDVLFSQA